ncbi:hypothetical protein ACFVYG_44480 [Streptomyces sp. NPDC058256]|uniref:MmyB family transcriptional regulator n=1 Tax=Streptomyces sp. NPDC058256 TaxID=3346408 RepID=UPI0036EDC67A
MMRILDRLEDTPAQVVTATGETIVQTPLAVTLLSDQTRFTGLARSVIYRWFADPNERTTYAQVDHRTHNRLYVAQLRTVASREGNGSHAAALAERLCAESAEFAELWAQHEVGVSYTNQKKILHPQGVRGLACGREDAGHDQARDLGGTAGMADDPDAGTHHPGQTRPRGTAHFPYRHRRQPSRRPQDTGRRLPIAPWPSAPGSAPAASSRNSRTPLSSLR